MKRVWLSIAVLTAFLVGGSWQSSQVFGQAEGSCPEVDAAADDYGMCPNLEEMRAYGECPWYFDNYRHGALADVAERQAADHEELASVQEADAAAVEADAVAEACVEAVHAADPIVLSDTQDAVDCWYDCQSDEYYRYEFSHVADQAVAGDDAGDESVSEADAWDEEACMDEYAGEYVDQYADEGFMDCADEAPVAEICREPITVTSEDVATEDAWRSDDYDAECYPYGYDYDWDYESADRMPVPSSPEADSDVVEEEADESVPPAPASELAQFDSEVLLSVARTLDRLGCSLQALSHYLTEVATTDVARQQHNMLRR